MDKICEKLRQHLKKILAFLPAWRGTKLLLPSVFCGVLAVTGLSGYQPPTIEQKEVSASEITALLQELSAGKQQEAEEEKSTKAKSAISRNTTAAAQSSEVASTLEKVQEDAEYKDGTYIGQAQGFGGIIKVEVTIKNGQMTKIQVKEAFGEDSAYLSKAKSLISMMIKKQTTNVDAVSGATYSSNGLIKAVRNALAKAEISDTKKNTKSKKKKNKKKKNSSGDNAATTVDTGAAVPYIDGTYYGSGEGFGGSLQVAVTIKSHKITAIEITESQDDAAFLERAKSLLSVIIAQQNTEVDVVSGATYSSQGLIEAVNNALKEAEKATNQKNGGEGSTQEGSSDSTQIENAETDKVQNGDNAPASILYNDGTYGISSLCSPDEWWDFEPYTMEMDITITGNKITAIENVRGTGANSEGNAAYINRAANKLVPMIVEKGSAENVDVVSGATCSSNAIIEGCRLAFEAAKIVNEE